MNRSTIKPAWSPGARRALRRQWKLDFQLYILLLPCVLYFLVFHYLPLFGIQIAFKDYKAVSGIWDSEWVGFKHFETFFGSYYFVRLLANTFLLNLYGLAAGFFVPVVLSLMLNRIRNDRSKKFIQTTIYIPHFISTVVMAGMLYIFLSPANGIFNTMIKALGGESVNFMAEAEMFRTIYILSDIWQSAGWGTILYLAALAGTDQGLYEAARIDGANIWQEIRHIDFPTIIPIMTMVFILDCGRLLSSNTDKALLLQTAGNISTSDIIGVYVYNVGLGSAKFSYTAAIGLFINLINFVMIMSVNLYSQKKMKQSLF